MLHSPTELEAFVRQRAPQIAQEIRQAAERSHNEADLVATVEPILTRFAKSFDVTLQLDRERALINGRADAVYNRFVIEYEPPRSLRKEKSYAANQHAIAQVQQYLLGLERVDRHKAERLAGAVLDGYSLIFVRYREGHWHIDDPLPVSAHSVETFLRYLLSLSTELALTPQSLQRGFGEGSPAARKVVPALYAALCATRNPKVAILFEQWRRQFAEITGYERGSGQLDLAALYKAYAIPRAAPADPERLFFALHTYYATFIKLLAVQVAQYYLMPIVGYDLNPLAVISARTNYLLALGELLAARTGEISIPVFLCDSILTPSQGQDLFTEAGYAFNTAVGRFTVPKALVSAERVERFAALLEECAEVKLAAPQFLARLRGAFGDLPDDQAALALALYEQLRALDERGINGIWARIIKNAFAPLFQGRFDYVAGNPPWVNWESLPIGYRDETVYLWQQYGMAATKGTKSDQFALGKQKRDISTLMTLVALDRYVRPSGRLGFVITQAVFKTVGGEGFRRFRLNDGTTLGVLQVDDMASLKPFEGAANRTAIAIIERGRETRYPVPYNLWFKPEGGSTIAEDLTLEEIQTQKIASFRRFVARPVDARDPTSPWISGRPRALDAVTKVLGVSGYQAKAGVCTWLNSVYWLEIVAQRPDGLVVARNLAEGAKRQAESVQAALEPDLLYPLLRGRDVNRWQATPQAHIILPHTPETSWQAIAEEVMQVRYPKTYAYLARFRDMLLTRSGYRLMRQGHPFYILVDVHTETFAPFKVVWPNIASELTCAVVSSHEGKVVVPQHIITLVPLDNENEAHFVCAAMNSSPVNFTLQSYSERGGKSFGTPHVLQNIRVPRYAPADPTHRQLAALSQAAHAAAAGGDAARVREIEAEIDELAARLWGLTDEELREIQESLAELG